MKSDITDHPAMGVDNDIVEEEKKAVDTTTDMELQKVESVVVGEATGTNKMKAIEAVWGKHGKLLIILALCITQITFEFDNTTIFTYYVYAQSSFSKISSLAALTTAGGLIFSVFKPLVAKLSDVFGRGECFPVILALYIVSYIMCAKSPNYETYACGYIFHYFAQTGINTLQDIIAADISTARQRGLAIQLQFLPNVFMPFTSAFVTSSVINGIGWRWGIGMLAIIMPVGLAPMIITLLGWQRKAKKAGLMQKMNLTLYDFFSQVDMGGMVLFSGGLALVLLPTTLAGDLADGWHTNWVIACLVIGGVFLVALPFYEYYVAKFPILPIHYFKSLTLGMALIMYAMDGMGLGVTHSYFYTWLIVARGYPIKVAVWINDVARAVQFLTGLCVGLTMWYFRRYKWTCAVGVVLRLIGYGVMFRIRNPSSTTAELVIVQFIQGVGAGLVGTACFVALTVNVPRREVAQMTSVAVCLSMLGSTIGTAIGGGIYTSHFKKELYSSLGDMATPALVNSVFNSITKGLPALGTPERHAIAMAYNKILAYFTYVAFGTVVPSIICAWYLPDKVLTDAHNLVEDDEPLPTIIGANTHEESERK